MSGKRYLIILGVLAVVGFGVSLGVSALFGSRRPPAGKGAAPGKQPSKSEAFLAGLSAPGTAGDKALPDRARLEEMIKDLRARIEEYGRKDEKLLEREKRLALAEENLNRRAKELETLRMELVGPLTRLKDAMAELERTRVLVGRSEKTNLQRIAATFEKMDSTRGSSILAGMCANNQTNDVVKILFYMDERYAGKILAEMTDQELAAKLTGLMQRIREEG